MKKAIIGIRSVVAIFLSLSLVIGNVPFAAAQNCDPNTDPNCGVYGRLPGEQPSAQASREHLSGEEAIGLAIEWAKFGKQPDAGKLVNTAIGVISAAYPPAGAVLAFAWGFIKALSGGPDPVGEALKQLNARVDRLEKQTALLQNQLNAVRDEGFRNANRDRLRELLNRYDRLKLLTEQLRLRPTETFNKQSIVKEAQSLAARFLPLTDPDQDLWYWSDMRVFTDQKGQVSSEMLPAAFKVLPTFEYYASALVLYMAAIEYESDGNAARVTSVYGKDLLRHAAFLSVRPLWREGQGEAPETLPEQVMERVRCYVTVPSKWPTNRTCTAGFECQDIMRRTIAAAGHTTFLNISNDAICQLTMRYPKPPSAQELQQRLAEITRNPRYGSQAIALWEQWGGRLNRVIANEDEMENGYGVEAMTLLADKLERLAKFGTTQKQYIGQFDFKYYTPQFLYAVKANGELLWYRHTIGVDKNPPKGPSLKDQALAQPSISGPSLKDQALAQPSISGPSLKDQALAQPSISVESARQTGEAGKIGSGAAATRQLGQSVMEKPSSRRAKVPEAAKAPVPRVFHQWEGPKLVGTGWQSFREVIPAGLSGIYALAGDGKLKWYRHDGFLNGEVKWKGPVDIGTGWNSFKKIVAGGDGILYGILPDGTLRWHRHGDVADASAQPKWSGPQVVGSGWQNFVHVFSTGEGVIYAVATDGRLLWYKHKGYQTGVNQWEGPKQVGTGWAGFKRVFSPEIGMIYGLQPDGTLLWYQHDGYKDGTIRWQGPTQIAADWGQFVQIFPRMTGTPAPIYLR